MPEKGNGAEDTAGRDGLGEGEDVGNRMVECVDDIDGELVRAGGKRACCKAIGRADARTERLSVERERCDFEDIPKVNDGVGEVVGQLERRAIAE